MKILGTIGDINPIDHGGGFVVQGEDTGDRPQLVYIDPLGEDEYGDPTMWEVYRMDVDRLESPVGEWFADSLDRIGGPYITEVLCGDDPVARASAYLMIANYHGLDNFDEYPLTFESRDEIEEYVKSITG